MMTTFKDEFVRRINPDDKYTLNDLKKILGEVYKEVAAAQKEEGKKKREKRERDENGEIIKKRPASAYNLFIKEQSAIIKAANPTFDSKTVFKMAIDEWKKQKGQDNKVEEEPTVSPKPTPDPEPEPNSTTSVHNSEPEPVPTPEPVSAPEPVNKVTDHEEKKTKKARKPKKTTQDDE
jgi:hypothetical protein